MKRIVIFVVMFISFFVFSGCTSVKDFKGIYVSKILNSQNVVEFSYDYEILEFDGKGGFTVKSYYERSNYSFADTFVGKLTTNVEGQYYIKGKTIELEWFIGDRNNKDTFEFDENSIYKATYFSDGKLNSKTMLYEKKQKDNLINLDGSYIFNVDKSKTAIFFSTTKYRYLIIDGYNFKFQNVLKEDTIKGELIIGNTNVLFGNVEEFKTYAPVMICLTDDNLTIIINDYNTLVYDIN